MNRDSSSYVRERGVVRKACRGFEFRTQQEVHVPFYSGTVLGRISPTKLRIPLVIRFILFELLGDAVRNESLQTVCKNVYPCELPSDLFGKRRSEVSFSLSAFIDSVPFVIISERLVQIAFCLTAQLL